MRATSLLGVLLGGLFFTVMQIGAAEPNPIILSGLAVDPPLVTLVGPDAHWTLLVHGQLSDGRVVDQTSLAQYASSLPGICRVSDSGVEIGRCRRHRNS